jgi:transposase-like protein
VSGRWCYLCWAIDQFGQVIDLLASEKRDLAARRFFTAALSHGRRPIKVTTDRAAAYPRVRDEQLPASRHIEARRANNPIEADHGRLKARPRPMRDLQRLRPAQLIGSGHAFVPNLRRGHYELATATEPIAGSLPRSPNSFWRSDQGSGPYLPCLASAERNSADLSAGWLSPSSGRTAWT